MSSNDTSPRELRRFGQTVGLAFGILALVLAARGYRFGLFFLIPSLLLVLLGFFAPRALRPIFYLWMGAAKTIGNIVSPMILSVVYYFVITPIAIIARLFRVEFMAVSIDKKDSTYWKEVEKVDDRYERQY